MKKTTSINLNRQLFNLDLDAYSKLDDYISAIKKHFDTKESADVIEDIEARIAEKFTQILDKHQKVIQIEDVNQVIKEMGSIKDITGNEDDSDETESGQNQEKSQPKKLYRDMDSKIIAGVASGLAWYFGIRSIFIRLAFLILLINPSTFWLSLTIYAACWLIIPKADNTFAKLEMKGRPATVTELQSLSEKKISDTISAVETKTQNLFQKLFHFCWRTFKFLIKLSLRLFAFFSFVFIIFLIVALIVGLIVLYFNPKFPYFDFTFIKSINSPFLEIGLVALAMTFLMPLIFFLDLSENLMQLKWNTSFRKVLTMLIIWAVSLITFASVAKITYPQYQSGLSEFTDHLKYFNYVDKSNSQTFTINNPKTVTISDVKQVKITQSNENVMVVTGNQHQINELKIQNSSDLLSVQGKNEVWFNCTDCTGYVSSVLVDIKTNNPDIIKLDNVDAEIYPTSGNLTLELVKKTGLKIIGTLDNLKLTTISNSSVVNLFEASINRLDANLNTSLLKSSANVINIVGDNQSRLIYKSNSRIFTQNNDQTIKQKYNLSRDDSDKLVQLVEQSSVTFDNQRKTVHDFFTSNFLYQLADDYANIYLIAKPKSDQPGVYLFWLTEKDEKISQVSYLKLDNWDKWNDFNFVNETLLEVDGQLYNPEMESISKQIFINKNTKKLEIYSSSGSVELK